MNGNAGRPLHSINTLECLNDLLGYSNKCLYAILGPCCCLQKMAKQFGNHPFGQQKQSAMCSADSAKCTESSVPSVVCSVWNTQHVQIVECAVCGVQNKQCAIRRVHNGQSVRGKECALHSVPSAQCIVCVVLYCAMFKVCSLFNLQSAQCATCAACNVQSVEGTGCSMPSKQCFVCRTHNSVWGVCKVHVVHSTVCALQTVHVVQCAKCCVCGGQGGPEGTRFFFVKGRP